MQFNFTLSSRHHDDEAEVAGQCPDQERQAPLAASKKRVDRQPPVALLYLTPHSVHELSIAPVEPSGQGVARG